jgi:hypothetical protein
VSCEDDLAGARHRILITGPDWGDCGGIVNKFSESQDGSTEK